MIIFWWMANENNCLKYTLGSTQKCTLHRDVTSWDKCQINNKPTIYHIRRKFHLHKPSRSLINTDKKVKKYFQKQPGNSFKTKHEFCAGERGVTITN
jgi:hypothetical protein